MRVIINAAWVDKADRSIMMAEGICPRPFPRFVDVAEPTSVNEISVLGFEFGKSRLRREMIDVEADRVGALVPVITIPAAAVEIVSQFLSIRGIRRPRGDRAAPWLEVL